MDKFRAESIELLFKNSAFPFYDISQTIKICSLSALKAKKIWVDIDADIATRAAVEMARAQMDEILLDVSSFAIALGMPRTSAFRMLSIWEAKGYCLLDKKPNKTYVLPTKKMVNCGVRYFEYLTELRLS